jgi:hypothetical protein
MRFLRAADLDRLDAKRKMKKILILLALLTMTATPLASEFKQHTVLEKEIQGDWLAAEYYVAQPPPELQQSIKSMSFQAKNMVEWKYVQDGKVHNANGRYGIYSFPTDQKMLRQLPRLIVAPANYPDAVFSGHVLLTLSNFELDFDSRFLQRWGKLIKARTSEGERVLFIRKKN